MVQSGLIVALILWFVTNLSRLFYKLESMAQTKEERPVYLLIFGQESDRWRVALKTAVVTHYFISLEDLFLFLERHIENDAALNLEGVTL